MLITTHRRNGSPRSRLQHAVTAALRPHTQWVKPRRRSLSVTFVRGKHCGTARIGSHWFVLDVPVRSSPDTLPSASRVSALLGHNRALRGAKFIMLPASNRLALRAEFPVDDVDADDDDRLTTRVDAACAGIRRGLDLLRATRTAKASAEPEPMKADTKLIDRLMETGWEGITVAGNTLRVELDVSRGFHTATVEPCLGGISLTTDVLQTGSGTSAGPVGARALGILLLRCAGIVRMASSAMSIRDDEPRPRLQVLLPSNASASLLHHALSALSVGAEMCAGEAEALSQDSGLARAYLSAQTTPYFEASAS